MIKCYFASLGCDKNLVDSEKMMAMLGDHAVIFTDDETTADVIIVNTCGFILDAKQESIETILELSEQKKTGNCKALVVTGCLAERYASEIRAEIPEIDAIVGTTAYDSIWEAVEKAIQGDHPELFRDLSFLPGRITKRVTTALNYRSYLKIAEGCDKHCTYCSIPSMRGPYRSVPIEELVEEATWLAAHGTRELIIVAQETTVYGVDLYQEKKLPELLVRLCAIPEIFWIRLLYCYPEEIDEKLILTMRDNPKICHYLDIPIQHADDEILRRMGRRTTRAELERTIAMIRSYIPDMALRTTFISGFPGETEEQHQNCIDFVRRIGFDRLGVFPYSEEEGTPAAGFPDIIPEEIRKKRADAIMEASQEIIFQKNEEMIGKKLLVLTEGYLPEENCYIGRSYRDAPDIDGYVFFTSGTERLTSSPVWVTITKAKGYDLEAEDNEITTEED